MTNEEVLEQLKSILKKYVENENVLKSLTMNSKLLHDLNISSAYLIDVFLDIEDGFGIEIKNEDFENISTVQDAIQLIQNQ